MSAETRLTVVRRTTLFASFRLPDFRNLWIGNALLFLGAQIRIVANGYLVYELTSSPLLLGIVGVGFAVPMLLLSPVGGVLADRMDRRRIVQAAQSAFAVVAAVVAVAILVGAVTWVHLLVGGMLQGAIWSVLVPSRQALIPSIVGRRLLTNALALMAGGFSAAVLAGPAIGGALYGWIGSGLTYLIVSACAVGAVFLTGRITDGAGGRPLRRSHSVWAGMVEMLRYVRTHRTLLALLAMALAYALLAMPFRLLLPVFVVDLYQRGPQALGLLASAMGVGSVAASLVVARLRPGYRGLLLICGGLVSGASILAIAAFPVYLFGLIGMMVMGVADVIRRSLNQTLLLEVSDPAYHGRTTALFMLTFGLMPLGALPASALAEWLGGRAAGAALGCGLILVSLLILRNHRLRRLR